MYPGDLKRSSGQIKISLKVVGNEKEGGLGGWLLFEDGFGPWQYWLGAPNC
jgi:hypothetical protein